MSGIGGLNDNAQASFELLSSGGVTLVAIRTRNYSALLPGDFDTCILTYVSSGNGVGEVQTATYYRGGTAGTTLSALSMAYGTSGQLTSISKT